MRKLFLTFLFIFGLSVLCLAAGEAEISGHFHPKIRVAAGPLTVRRPCFVLGRQRMGPGPGQRAPTASGQDGETRPGQRAAG